MLEFMLRRILVAMPVLLLVFYGKKAKKEIE